MLNRKGFTLIELLAVIVILAVVMGVASTSVLSAMNNSRKSSLENSAKTAADAFRTAYAEYSMGGSSLFLGVDTTTPADETQDSNPRKGVRSLLSGGTTYVSYFKQALNITMSSVGSAANTNYYSSYSFVNFDSETSTFTVCLVANRNGSYYVDEYAKNSGADGKDNLPAIFVGKNVKKSTNFMWACSNGENSWT